MDNNLIAAMDIYERLMTFKLFTMCLKDSELKLALDNLESIPS